MRAALPGIAVVLLAVLLPATAPDPLRGAEPDAEAEAEGGRFFVQRIEPLLREHCYACHSHGTGEMEGGLTLDSRSGWVEGGGRGPAIVPGKPAESLLIRALRHQDEGLQMPPDEKLPEAVIQLFVQWIERGAPDPRSTRPVPREREDPTDWWSWRPLQRPAVPGASEAGGANAHPVDAFVQQKLASERLSAAPRADRRTLIRRLYFDLHGLPPTFEAVERFVADPDPRAYEKLVDRLLASPRYGERWARYWLDTVHFADSHGCEHDVLRPNAWRYRDYVIASLNRDTPWPRFIREQLAADRFFPDDPQRTAALGFIAAGPLELSRAGTAPITFDYLDRDDMVAQTMAAFTSTTANCARCHDHKFDPISQEDYYALQAVFAGIGKGDVEFDGDPAVASERRRWTEVLSAVERRDAATLLAAEHAELVDQWERQLGDRRAVWTPLQAVDYASSNGSTLEPQEDGSLLSSGERPDKDTYTITAATSLQKVTALRLDVLADDRLPMKGPGRQDNGNLHLSELEIFVVGRSGGERVRQTVRTATADWNQEGWTISHAVDGNPATAWGIYPRVGASHHAVFELEQAVDLSGGEQLVVALQQLHGGGHLIGRCKLYATEAAGAAAELLPEAVLHALQTPREGRTEPQRLELAAHALRQQAQRQLAGLPEPWQVYAVSRSWSHARKLPQPMAPKVVHVLRRGDIQRPGEVAVPGALAAIEALPGRFPLDDPADEASRRAALADWLAAADNPLTWRSIVNRVWAWHFGRGLCDTPNDFGRMGGQPSHPEMLDWLAVWFRDDAGGSLKRLHRLILTSETWQRQSESLAESLAVDADNRWLGRMNRRPLDAESYRDAVLQVSGRIDLAMGGPGIQQFTQSPGAQVTPKLDYDAFDWSHPSAARRSIYRVVWRGIADPFMEVLDFPDLGLLPAQRNYSVSALRALAVFNNDFVLHHSRVLAERLESEQESLQGQLVRACRLLYLRDPSAGEQALLSRYARRHGLAATCRVLLNSSEFMFVD